jgi:hypothetical protein
MKISSIRRLQARSASLTACGRQKYFERDRRKRPPWRVMEGLS